MTRIHHFSQANILINDENHAVLADFGLMNVAIEVGASCVDTSAAVGGTTRWMAPELLSPDESSNELTKSSDVYALGMVILEVRSFRFYFLR